MSQENVELVRAAADAFGREGVHGLAEFWTDDIDHRAAEGALDDRGPIHGKEALRAYVQDWLDTFDDFRSEPVELIDAGQDKVIAVTRISGRAKLSGVETDLTFAALYTIRGGKIARGRESGHATKPSKPPGCVSRKRYDGHMPKRSGKPPRDVNRLAATIVDEATAEAPKTDPDEGKDPAAVALGRRGGLKGGKARAKKMSAKERSDAARKAARARWS